jgi:hypothetical protein
MMIQVRCLDEYIMEDHDGSSAPGKQKMVGIVVSLILPQSGFVQHYRINKERNNFCIKI